MTSCTRSSVKLILPVKAMVYGFISPLESIATKIFEYVMIGGKDDTPRRRAPMGHDMKHFSSFSRFQQPKYQRTSRLHENAPELQHYIQFPPVKGTNRYMFGGQDCPTHSSRSLITSVLLKLIIFSKIMSNNIWSPRSFKNTTL